MRKLGPCEINVRMMEIGRSLRCMLIQFARDKYLKFEQLIFSLISQNMACAYRPSVVGTKLILRLLLPQSVSAWN